MTPFWLGALLLGAGAAAFVLWPLLRGRREAASRALRARSNLAVYEDRLAELETDRAEGRIGAAEFETLRTELERALLRDVDPADVEAAGTPDARGGRTVLLAAAVLAPLVALALYADWGLSLGSLGELELAGDVRVLDDTAAATEPELRALATRLAARTERAPDDPDAWFLLGRAALAVGEYERAARAFGRVSELTAGAVVPGVFRAQALYLADERSVTPRVRTAVDAVLERAPGQPIMLELLATDAFRGERWEEAAQLFARVLQAGEVSDPERQRFLLQGLTVARERAGLPPLPFAGAGSAAGSATGAGEGEASIAVEVTVPEEVLAALPATARLFVLARNPGGGMPLAVERHAPAARVQLELTAADAMGPAGSLASAGSVEVVARLSLAGTAARSEGDLESVAGPVPAAAGARVAFTLAPDGPGPRVDLPARAPAATAAAPAEPAASPAPAEASVRVLVELAPELSAPADATVYVFARAPGGPPMPLAVTRLEAAALPTVVTLSDAQAMVPGQGLGSAPEVELVARVSASGDVRGAPGDLEGRAGPVDPRATERVVPLLVDRVLP